MENNNNSKKSAKTKQSKNNETRTPQFMRFSCWCVNTHHTATLLPPSLLGVVS